MLTTGDTYYVDTVSAYEGLPENIKERIEPLAGHFSYLKFRDSVPGVTEEEAEYLRRGWDHPLVTVHPLTGKVVRVIVLAGYIWQLKYISF